MTLRWLLQQRRAPPPLQLPSRIRGLPAPPPPPFAGFGEGARGVKVGACAEGARTGRAGEMTTRRRGWGTTAGRKLGEMVQAKMGVATEGVPWREAGTPGEKEREGAGSGRGSLAGFHS